MRESLASFCQRNDRADLLREWDSERNLPLTPESVSYGSKKKVWWTCEHGHHWQAAVHTRTGSGTGCPICTNRTVQSGDNDLATQLPALAKEWHPTKNGALTPKDVVPGSRRKVWWICPKGHEYQAMISSRAQGSGCPVCAGKKIIPGENDLASQYPTIAKEWHPTMNGSLTPDHVLPGSRKKVWWQCRSGHIWQAVVYSRTGNQRSGCPVCTGYAVGKRREKYRLAQKDKPE